MTVHTEINLPTCRNSESVCSWFFISTTWQLLSSKAHTRTVVDCWSKTANTGNKTCPMVAWQATGTAATPQGARSHKYIYRHRLVSGPETDRGGRCHKYKSQTREPKNSTEFWSHGYLSVSLGCLDQLWPKVVKTAHSCSAHPQPDVSHCDFMQACLGLTRSLFFYNAGNKETSHQLLEAQQIWAVWL